MFVAALIVLIIAVLIAIAVLFGADVTTADGRPSDGVITIDLGAFDLQTDATAVFFLGIATLLLFVLGLGMFRSAAKRASARRADKRKVSELSSKLDAYKRDERDEGSDITRDNDA